MDDVTRRTLLAATAAGGFLAAAKAGAQTKNRCHNRSARDMAAPIPARVISPVTGRIPICLFLLPPITARWLICVSHSRTPMCG